MSRPTTPVRRLPAAAAAAILTAAVLAGCAGSLGSPPATTAPTPGPTPSLAVRQVRAQLEASLRLANIALIDPSQQFRPPEPPALVSAPRGVFQAVLPDDPTRGYVVVYDLGDPAAAADAGRAMTAYLAAGPTRVQFPPDTRFVLRQVGSTLVFYHWSPAGSTDPTAGRVADVLATLGSGFSPPA